jgi:GT2 family glycosyltransferase
MTQNKIYNITASLVLYKNGIEEVRKAILSLLNTELNIKLFLVDNSPEDALKVLSDLDSRVEYIFTGKNLGYGKANNLIINKVLQNTEYHLVMNPDVYFEKGTLEALYDFMQANEDIGLTMPRVCHYDGSEQKLCKLLPTPRDLIIRRFIPDGKYKDKISRIYNMWDADYEKQMDVPFLSGSFMFMRASVLAEVKGFDERFFLYCEDLDLCRRIGEISRTVYFPGAKIYHGYQKASYLNTKLMLTHSLSAIKYFNKWGWFFDKKRKEINTRLGR